jgi:transcription termination factor Rho
MCLSDVGRFCIMRPAMDASPRRGGRIPVTETTEIAATSGGTGSRTGSLSALRLPQLQALASELGLSGTGKMRKSDLVEAITARQRGGSAPRRASSPAKAPVEASTEAPAGRDTRSTTQSASQTGSQPSTEPAAANGAARHESNGSNGAASANGTAERGTNGAPAADTAERTSGQTGNQSSDQAGSAGDQPDGGQRREPRQRNRQQGDRQQGDRQQGDRQQGDRQQGDRAQQGDRQQGDRQQGDRQQGDRQQGDRQQGQQGPRRDDDDGDGSRRGRRNRYRDRKRRGGTAGPGGRELPGQYDEPEISEDDVLVPVAGILDVLDNYAFVRTSGYLPGPNDVYVSLGQVKKSGLRKGDAVTGAVRQVAEADLANQRQKFNALVRLDTVNGQTVEQAKARVEFSKLTPLYPQDRLRLETEPGILTTRIIDLVAPIGKGQRGLIVSPAKAGKTLILQAIANSISVNNPECHLMVVLVDERPEEVTDMQRAIKGEVIASTFDRPADDHTTVAELAIERAKRLVELGHDVVVLLDSITRLGRAYNLAAPASGRIMSGGVDSSALYPPKRFFGAARNVENGGSLTIIATALIDTGSKMDEVIFEEFKGTGNMELRLDRRLADKRLFPAVDVNPSGTRREEILLGREELAVSWKLRRVLTALDSQQALELMLDRLRKTSSNAEFLMSVQKSSPSVPGQSDDD